MPKSEQPIVLDKSPAYLKLKSGDPWTFIEDEPRLKEDGNPVSVGDFISCWFATNEAGRIFRVERIHKESVYETTFIGFHCFKTADNPDAYSCVVNTNGRVVNLPGLEPVGQVPEEFKK